MNPEVQMVSVQDTFVPENVDVGAGEAGGGNPLAKVHQYLRGRYLKAIVTGVVLAAAGAAAGYFVVPLKYTSHGQIHIRSQIQGAFGQTNSDFGEGFIQTQMNFIGSQSVVSRAVESDEWKALPGDVQKSKDEQIADFMDSLELDHPAGSELITVSFRDSSSARATAGAHALMAAYKDLSAGFVQDDWTYRMQILNNKQRDLLNQIAAYNQRISEISPKIYAKDLPTVRQDKLAQKQEVENRIASVTLMLQEMAGATTQPGAEASAKPNPAELTLAVAERMDPEIHQLRKESEEKQRQVNVLSRNMGLKSPLIVNLTSEIQQLDKDIEKRMDALKERIEKGGDTAIAAAGGASAPTRQQLEAKLAGYRKLHEDLAKELGEQVKIQQEIDGLQDQIIAQQVWLTGINDQIAKQNLDRSLFTLDRRITVYPPSTPVRPDKDRRIIGAGGGGFGGFAVGMGIFLAIGFFDRRLRSVADARDSLDRSNRILGILPYLPEDLADPDQSTTAAFCVHHIRTLLQVGGSGSANPVIAVTSASPGDGKTSLVISLGLSYAATGAKTLLIDSDLIGAGLTSRANAIARRKIGSILLREKRITQQQLDEALDLAHRKGKRLGEILLEMGHLKQGELDKALSTQQETSLGLLDVLDGEPLGDCVFPGWANNLSILPVGNVGANHAGQISLRAVRKIIAEARTQYDVVLIDTGPILGSLEACLIAAAVDEVIVAVARDQQRPLVEKTFSRLREVGARLAGIVFNRAPREDIESGGYMSSATSQRLQSPMLRETGEDAGSKRLQRLGPVVRAVAGENGPNSNPGDGL